MDDAVSRFLKHQTALRALMRDLGSYNKAKARATVVHAECLGLAESALGMTRRLADLGQDLRALNEALTADVERIQPFVASERALFAGRVAAALKAKGIVVEGNLPLLRARAFTLEFDFGTRSRITIWLGPRMERLVVCEPDPEMVASAVATLNANLFGAPFDGMAVLEELLQACRMAITRQNLPVGSRVPLTALMAEWAMGRQDPAFFADPRRENFRGTSRAEFAALLSRLTVRATRDEELRFDVATMAQSRRPVDHLWVPRGDSGDGVLLATAHVTRRT